MASGAAAFVAGLLSGGLNGYNMRRDWDRQEARDKLDTEERTLRMDKLRADAVRQQATDKATQDFMGIVNSGQAPSTPGGTPYTQEGPPIEAAGDQPITQPLWRPATADDRTKALMNVFASKGDVNTLAAYAKDDEQKRLAKDDLEYATKLAADPSGEAATGLIGLLGKQKVPGVTMQTDPKTGLSFAQVATPGGEPRNVELSGNNLMKMAIAQRKLARGDISGLQDLADIDKGLAGAAVAGWKMQQEIAKLNNDTVGKGSEMATREITTALAVNKDLRDSDKQRGDLEDTKNQREAAAAAAAAAGWTPEQVAAVRAGAIKPPGAQAGENAPMEVKLGEALVRAGLAKTPADGLKMAMQSKGKSPEAVRQDVFAKALAATMGNAEAAQKATEQAMKYLFTEPAGGAATPRGPQPGQIIGGFEFKGGNPKDKRNWNPVSTGKVQ